MVVAILILYAFFFFFYMSVLIEYVCTPEEGVRFLGTGVTESELPCGSLESNLCPLKGQSVLLTTEQSLHLLIWFPNANVKSNIKPC